MPHSLRLPVHFFVISIIAKYSIFRETVPEIV